MGLKAQVKINYYPVDSSAKAIIKAGILKSDINNKEFSDYLQSITTLLHQKGYWSASVDSFSNINDTANIFLYVGEKINQFKLKVKEPQQKWLNQLNYKPKEYSNWQMFEQLQEKLLQYFENNGYPFAKVGLDSFDMKNGWAWLNINEGNIYQIDSFKINGTASVAPYIINKQTGIANGSIYSLEKINKISSALSGINYIEETQKPSVMMNANSGLINLFYNEKKSSQFNFLLGLLPVNNQTKKFQVSGDIMLQLRNAFGKGEGILANFQQLQPSSPRLQIGYDQPFIFKTSFGIDTKFELFKKDTHFLQVFARVGIIFQADASKSFKFYFQQQNNSLLFGAIDTNLIKQSQKLPDEIDANLSLIGMNANLNTTDYKPNPRKGWDLFIQLNAGIKKIKKNNNITELKTTGFDYNSLYDNIKINDYRINLQANISKYFPTSARQVLKTSVTVGWINSKNLFRNELFQVGGFRLLRGFDEESIFASSFLVPSLEYRLLSGTNSYFYVFSDGGFVKLATNYRNSKNSFISGGLGLAFQTKTGIINFSYALGKKFGENIGIRQGSKIHFGFINYF